MAKDPSKLPSSYNPTACFASKIKAHSMIVTVWLHHRNDPSNVYLMYVLLDDPVQHHGVGQITRDNLSISGPEMSLLLSTMHASDEQIKSQKIEGLVVRVFHQQVTLQLPKAQLCQLKYDVTYRRDYTKFMQDIIERGYAEKVPQEDNTLKIDGSGTYPTTESSLIPVRHTWGSHLLLVGVLGRF
ncbi:hypothetical protein ACROYT_G013668 [Oculina patagonica]